LRFLAVHPFQDGNGKISRALTTLLLLRSGYSYIPFSSMERVIEDNKEDMAELRQIAREMDGELWMSAVTHRDSPVNDHRIPEPLAHLEDAIDVILALEPRDQHVTLRLLKDHNNPDVSPSHVALDPSTLLLITE
jgi:hypothetical protein